MNVKFKKVISTNTKLNALAIVNRKLKEENERLMSKIVFLTKQVSTRDIVIGRVQELASLGAEGELL